MLQCVAVCCSVLQCVAVCWSMLQCVAVYCSVLQYVQFRDTPGAAIFSPRVILHNHLSVAVCCSVLQCVAVCSILIHSQCRCKFTSRSVLQHVTLCCSVFNSEILYCRRICSSSMSLSKLSVAECCRVLQSVAEFCSVLQSVAEYCSVLKGVIE